MSECSPKSRVLGWLIMLAGSIPNSASIQAVSALVAAFASIVLVIITVRYVRLTSRLAHVAEMQVHMQRDAAKAERRVLFGMVTQLRQAVKSLPLDSEPGADQRIRETVSLSDFSYDRFETLASKVSLVAQQWAARAVLDIKFQSQQTEAVRATPPGLGFNYRGFQWPRWKASMEFVQMALDGICEELEKATNPHQ
jgi:hypothetical protein